MARGRRRAKRSSKRSSRATTGRKKGRRGAAAREKGVLFESVVTEYFRSQGFRVRRNVVLRGFSGARHEVDVLVEAADGRRGLVEAKNYSKPVSKEWVMKAYNVARDLGLDMVFVVSASGFTEGARKIAEVLGVELLDLDRMAEVVRLRRGTAGIPTSHVKPRFGPRVARELSSRFAVKKLFRPVETPTSVDLLYIPFYMVEGTHVYYEEEGLIFKKTVERRRKATIMVEALEGRIPLPEDDTVVLVSVANLRDAEKELLRLLIEEPLTRDDLVEETEWSPQKLGRALKALLKRGLVEYDEQDETFTASLPTIEELEELVQTLPQPRDGQPEDGKTMKPRVAPAIAQTVARDLYNIEHPETRLAYLPTYRVKLEKKDRSYRYVYLAAWTDREPLQILGIHQT